MSVNYVPQTKLYYWSKQMNLNIFKASNTQPIESPVSFTLKLRLAIMAILTANAFMNFFLPNGIFSAAYAGESDDQTQARIVQRVNAHREADQDWSQSVASEIESQHIQPSALQESQD
jgi:hypothetical protein